MPSFQFTPILNVVTDDNGTLRDLQWDWESAGQGQWNPVTLEHEATEAHESVCENLDKLPTRWVPEGAWGPGSIIGDQIHEPINPRVALIETIRSLAQNRQDEADKQARQANPRVHDVTGHDPFVTVLREIATEIATLTPTAASYPDALATAADRIEQLGSNPEYERGMVNLLADLYAEPEKDTGARMEEIEADLRARLT